MRWMIFLLKFFSIIKDFWLNNEIGKCLEQILDAANKEWQYYQNEQLVYQRDEKMNQYNLNESTQFFLWLC